MDEKTENSIFDEMHVQKERIEELERQVATLMGSVQGIQQALKLILAAAKVAHEKETHEGRLGSQEVPGG